MNNPKRPAVAAFVVIVLVVTAALVVKRNSPSSAADAEPGPIARASIRSLGTTLKESGTVQRVDQRLITFASATTSPSASNPTASAPAAVTDQSDGQSAAPMGAATSAETEIATASAGSAPVEAQPLAHESERTATAGGASGADNTGGEEGAVRAAAQEDGTGETLSTTEPAPSTTEPAPPTTEPAPTTSQSAPSTTQPAPSTTARAAVEPREATPPTNDVPSAPMTGAGQAPAGQQAPAVVEEEPPATLTALLEVGATANRGTVLYAADDEPTVALLGTIPAWRALDAGVEAGGDVRQLEENLVALGFGSGITVDDSFTSTTAMQVQAWESSIGRTEPDGRVEVGDIVFLSGVGDVIAHEAAVGDPVEPGDPILQLGSQQLVVKATIDANDAAVWEAGTTATLTWDNGETSEATVFGVSREVADGAVEVVIALGDGDAGRPSGSPATIEVPEAQRDGVVAVPISAIVASPGGGDAVRVPAGDDAGDRIVPVKLGVVSEGWAEVAEGLEAGWAVRLPG